MDEEPRIALRHPVERPQGSSLVVFQVFVLALKPHAETPVKLLKEPAQLCRIEPPIRLVPAPQDRVETMRDIFQRQWRMPGQAPLPNLSPHAFEGFATLFPHYAFDRWMWRTFPHIPFERYADDAICHRRTRLEADHLKPALERRFADCHLMPHPEKIKTVYHADSNRGASYPQIQFDFPGFTFRPRRAKNR